MKITTFFLKLIEKYWFIFIIVIIIIVLASIIDPTLLYLVLLPVLLTFKDDILRIFKNNQKNTQNQEIETPSNDLLTQAKSALQNNEKQKAHKLFETIKKSNPNKEVSAFASYQLGLLAYYFSNFRQATQYFEEAVRLKNKNADYLTWAAKLLHDSAVDYQKAEKYYMKALKISKKALNKNDPNISKIYNSLANLYRDQGRYEEAEEYCENALEIFQETLAKNHPYIAETYGNLANLYKDQAKYEKAETHYKQALEIFQETVDKDHIAQTYHDLANLHRDQAKYKEAEG